ncbi:VOC family protein [Roseibium aestuarii]|uniref:VOC family protein n=1 Tax=Roseibium aestuarii TaxID=2600299 RepID=A0ABW4K1I4_9HYPH|nr:VOC family protein [Roseibium aestuarii]
MQGIFVWYELYTTDPALAAEFYSKVLGWTTSVNSMAGFDYTMLHVPGFEMGTAGMLPRPQEMEQAGVPPHWIGYIGVMDLDAMVRRMTAKGSAVHFGPADIPNIGRFASLADPQGAAICLFEPGPMDGPMPDEPAPGTQGTVGWHELHAGDGPAAFDFYAEMFDWQKDMAVDMGELGIYQTVRRDGPAFAGIMTKMPQVPVPLWAYYFCVDDIEAAVDRVSTNGGTVLHGPQEVPGGSRIANCQDPQGAMFSLVEPARA